MQKTTYLSIGLTTVLISALGYVSVIIGKGGWHHQDEKGESFDYITEPISKMTDSTESSRALVDFTKNEFLTKEVVKVGDNMHVAIGWALANSIMIEGDDGIIIVDTTESPDSMKDIMTEFRKITSKPVVAIIFTHFHTDHNIGTGYIIEEEKKTFPNVTIEIYSHELTKELMFGFSDTYDIGFIRGLRQLGVIVPPVVKTGGGIGPFLKISTSSQLYIPVPTITYVGRQTFIISGVEIELIHTPGETDDQTTVWLPKERAIMPGDNIYKTFPNIYAIRGSPSRNAKRWYTSVDLMRQLGAQHLVMSHTQPVTGEEAIADALLAYRDGIKYVHDQTVRLLNKGFFPTQIVDQVKLPDFLAEHPFLQQHYGNVPWSIRGVFTNYLGWFSGNPRDLHPMTDGNKAVRMARLVAYAQTRKCSPVEVMLQEAQISHKNSHNHFKVTGKHLSDEDKWALELADAVLEMENIDQNFTDVARQIKISALTALGVEEISANGRNYYLTYALELANNLKVERTKSARGYVINTSSMERVFGILCAKVNGLQCQKSSYIVRFSFSDEKSFAVTLRNSVCDVIQEPSDEISSQVHLYTSTTTLKAVYAEDLDFDTQVDEGTVKVVSGTIDKYKSFMECFDPVNSV